MKVSLVFDYFRGTRLDKSGISTYKMMKKLKEESSYPQNLTLSFFRHNDTSDSYPLIRTSGLIEAFGTFHSKIAIFDNDVIITGANLTKD